MKVVNIFGLYMTGKSALHDALCQNSNVFSISQHFDLDIIRVPNGLNDLLFSIKNCSKHHQSYSIKKFIELLDFYDEYDHLFERYYSQKINYQNIFSGYKCFKNQIINLLTKDGYSCHHFHSYSSETFFSLLKRKFNKLLFNKYFDNCTLYDFDNKELVIEKIRKLLLELIKSANGYKDQDIYLLNNCNFIESIDMSKLLFPDIKQIAVIRNPLDIVASIISMDPIHNKNPDLSIKLNRLNNINKFLLNYDSSLQILINNMENEDIMVVKFEDLIYNYNKSIISIEKYLGIHLIKMLNINFDINASKNNIGIYKNLKKEIINESIGTMRNLKSINHFYANFY